MNARDILNKFGCIEVRNLKKISRWSSVYYFEYNSKKAILKKTKSNENEAANLIKWERFLFSNQVNIVTPITPTLKVEDDNWVIYPFIRGNNYGGMSNELYSAGMLLGKIHLLSDLWYTDLNEYVWPNHNNKSIQEDINSLYELSNKVKSDLGLSHIITWLNEHQNREQLLKASGLPYVNATWDYKANNLIFVESDKVFLIDPDNAGYLPRIFDLALGTILFNNECESGTNSLFSGNEWKVFFKAYSMHINLSKVERKLWVEALKYMFIEEAVWVLLDNNEKSWASQTQGKFLCSLLNFPACIDQYKLS